MPSSQYEQERERFRLELEAYGPAMEQYSHAQTDEVGHTKATFLQTGNCFAHLP